MRQCALLYRRTVREGDGLDGPSSSSRPMLTDDHHRHHCITPVHLANCAYKVMRQAAILEDDTK